MQEGFSRGFKGQEFKNSRISTSAASSASASSASTPSVSQDNYLGIPYGEIIKKWWQLYNDGQEPMRSNRNTLTFEPGCESAPYLWF